MGWSSHLAFEVEGSAEVYTSPLQVVWSGGEVQTARMLHSRMELETLELGEGRMDPSRPLLINGGGGN